MLFRTERKAEATLKIIIYSHYFAPSVGGVETSVEALAKGLAAYRAANGSSEFEVVIVTNTAAGQLDDHAFPFRVVRNPGLQELLGLIRRANVIHLAGPTLVPLFLARIYRKPIVVEHHGYQAICVNGLLLHHPDRSVCPGHFQAGQFRECLRCQRSELSSWLKSLKGLAFTKIRNVLCHGVENIAITDHVRNRHGFPNSRVIYYGIEDSLASARTPSRQSSSASKVCFAYVGRFVSEKGIHVLLQAASQLCKQMFDFEVLLIGDGPERASVEREIERQGLQRQVQVTGFLRGAELSSLLERVQVVVMPSVWEETAGLSAIEHMMKGRLVIASSIGGLGEVVGSAGLVCPPGRVDELAACMSDIIAHPEQVVTVGRQARNRALGTFGYGRMIEEHVKVYQSLASA